ncbi:Na(+)/citrate cotransporter-like isoform X2 [Tubulanus polymorphus]|uniref:Na(+)/citrate cotransporter-like isoform X2 n=1 Tax=Tubulanus polymorphus TaxID=672921 RepID=UPI003DA29679
MILVKRIFNWWKLYVLILAPLLLLPIPILQPSSVSKCAYLMLLMAVYWVTEALPLGVTALIPVFLCPTLGLMKSKDICPNYMKDTCLLFMGGLMVAVAVEKWNLHKRIALRVLMIFGTKPKWLMLGFMIPTWFLSMWISNTATTPMMVSIVIAVLEQMKHSKSKNGRKSSIDHQDDVARNETEITLLSVSHSNSKFKQQDDEKCHSPADDSEPTEGSPLLPLFADADPEFKNLCKAMLLSIAFAANTGGIATLTGTPPNLVLKGILDLLFPGENGISFTTWIVLALPLSIINMLLCWLWLQCFYMGFARTFCGKGDAEDSSVKKIMRDAYKALGPMKWPEISCLVIFILLALLWLTREPEFIPGWAVLFPKGYVTDASAGIFITVVLFMFPSKLPSCKAKTSAPPLLDWETANSKIPWHIILLLGGGFALADVSQASGLSKWLGTVLSGLKNLEPSVVIFILTIVIALVTNLFSNTATATLMLPILADLAVIIEVNPLYLMLPAAISASFAFMLPVATPPNAMVYASGYVSIKDMVVAGSVVNIICVFTINFAVNTYGYVFFDLGTYPSWAQPINSTAITPTINTTTFPTVP